MLIYPPSLCYLQLSGVPTEAFIGSDAAPFGSPLGAAAAAGVARMSLDPGHGGSGSSSDDVGAAAVASGNLLSRLHGAASSDSLGGASSDRESTYESDRDRSGSLTEGGVAPKPARSRPRFAAGRGERASDGGSV